MLLDHFNSFADFRSVDQVLDTASMRSEPNQVRPASSCKGGVLPETLIETGRGFLQARELKAGDTVFTFDGGCQDVQSIKLSVPRLTAMMRVPAGALGNDCDLVLPADQMVALDMDVAESLFDVPVVVAKLVSLAGYNGIATAEPQRIARVYIEFDEEELLWAESGMLILASRPQEDSAFTQLSLTQARCLLSACNETPLPAGMPLSKRDFPAAQVDMSFGSLERFFFPLAA